MSYKYTCMIECLVIVLRKYLYTNFFIQGFATHSVTSFQGLCLFCIEKYCLKYEEKTERRLKFWGILGFLVFICCTLLHKIHCTIQILYAFIEEF